MGKGEWEGFVGVKRGSMGCGGGISNIWVGEGHCGGNARSLDEYLGMSGVTRYFI